MAVKILLFGLFIMHYTLPPEKDLKKRLWSGLVEEHYQGSQKPETAVRLPGHGIPVEAAQTG